jgi:hypothetical protein
VVPRRGLHVGAGRDECPRLARAPPGLRGGGAELLLPRLYAAMLLELFYKFMRYPASFAGVAVLIVAAVSSSIIAAQRFLAAKSA